jgi:hypothetical protein
VQRLIRLTIEFFLIASLVVASVVPLLDGLAHILVIDPNLSSSMV